MDRFAFQRLRPSLLLLFRRSSVFGLGSCVLGPRLLSLVFKVIFADVVAFYSVCRRRPGRRRRRR